MHDDHLARPDDDGGNNGNIACTRREERRRASMGDDPFEPVRRSMRAKFAEWWSPPGARRDWVELQAPDGSGSFRGWWQLASYEDSPGPATPLIEVDGLVPAAAPSIELPELVDAVGWWVYNAMPMSEARRWFALGIITLGEGVGWSWVTEAVLRERDAMGSGLLVRSDHCRWLLSDAGYELFASLRSEGVGLAHLGLVACDGLGLNGPISPLLEGWIAELDRDLERPPANATLADECPRGASAGRGDPRPAGQAGRVPHMYSPAETFGIRRIGVPRRDYCRPLDGED